MFMVNQLIGFGAGGPGLVTLAFLEGRASSTDNDTFSFAAVSLGAAAANRYIVVCATTASSDGDTLTGCTIAGVTATEVASQATANNDVAIYIANVPSGTSGTIVCTTTTEARNCGIAVYRMVGILSPTAFDTGANTVDPLVMSLNVPAGGAAIGVIGARSGSVTATWTNLSEDHDALTESGDPISSASSVFTAPQTGLSITGDWSGVTTTASGVCASWSPA